jgi:hypothetical protein
MADLYATDEGAHFLYKGLILTIAVPFFCLLFTLFTFLPYFTFLHDTKHENRKRKKNF